MIDWEDNIPNMNRETVKVLRKEYIRLNEQLEAIKALFRSAGEPVPLMFLPEVQTNSDFRNMGLRSAMREAMKLRPEGFKPQEMAALLLKGGFEYNANTSFHVRIGSELWKLMKNGSLEQTNGRYHLPMEG